MRRVGVIMEEKRRIAVATDGDKGLDDTVSGVFGRAKTFTLIDVDKSGIRRTRVIKNTATTYDHGAGPIVIKTLLDQNVNVVVAAEFGPGAKTLLQYHKIRRTRARPGTKVSEAVKHILS
jgi:predicted Fe-Mo cluster-binding NifX family protein